MFFRSFLCGSVVLLLCACHTQLSPSDSQLYGTSSSESHAVAPQSANQYPVGHRFHEDNINS